MHRINSNDDMDVVDNCKAFSYSRYNTTHYARFSWFRFSWRMPETDWIAHSLSFSEINNGCNWSLVQTNRTALNRKKVSWVFRLMEEEWKASLSFLVIISSYFSTKKIDTNSSSSSVIDQWKAQFNFRLVTEAVLRSIHVGSQFIGRRRRTDGTQSRSCSR